jgi:hypothetical protein
MDVEKQEFSFRKLMLLPQNKIKSAALHAAQTETAHAKACAKSRAYRRQHWL